MLDCHQMYFSLFLLLEHSHIMVYAKCTPFDSLLSGVLLSEDLIFTYSPVIFIICHPKTPFFVLKHPKFSSHPLKDPIFTENSHFCHKKTIPFLS